MDFVVDQDADLIPYVLSQILDTSINGITLSDPHRADNPIIYANEAEEKVSAILFARACLLFAKLRRFRAVPTVEMLRATWNKTSHPLVGKRCVHLQCVALIRN